MTIDTVVQKTGITLGLTILVAIATWFLTPPLDSEQAAIALYPLILVGGLGAFALSMVNSFKKVVSPGLVLAYAALEGLLVGAFSKLIEGMFGGGLVLGAVAGTFAAVVGTLAAYKFFNIKVGDKFRTWVIAAMFGFVAVSLLDVVLAFFGADLGVNGFGGMGRGGGPRVRDGRGLGAPSRRGSLLAPDRSAGSSRGGVRAPAGHPHTRDADPCRPDDPACRGPGRGLRAHREVPEP